MIEGNKLQMHTQILLIAVFVCASVLADAQVVFSKTFFQDRPSMRFSSVVSIDTEYLIMGVTVNKVPPYTDQGLFLKVSPTGEVESYQAEPDTNNVITGFFWNTLLKVDNDRLTFTGYGGDTAQCIVTGILSKLLDTITLKRFYIPNTFALQGLSLCKHDDYYFIAGVHNSKPGFDANVILLKMDTFGNVVWHKYYDQWAMDFAQSIAVLNNGNIMLGAQRNDLGQPIVRSNTWLLEVDTGGNVVRQWFDPNDSTYVAEGFRQTQDGGFIYGAQKKNYQSGFSSVSYNATIIKMDNNFNKQWTFSRGGNDLSIYTAITDIEELPDGSFIAAGHLSYYGTDTALNGYIVKLDVNGNVIWERNYRGINTTQSLNFLSDIDILTDGGLIAVGQCQLSGATPPQVGWFLKLDSNGCEVENCLVGIETPKSPKGDFDSPMQIQPNPASDRVWVEVEPGLLGGELKIYDISGRLVKQLIVEALQFVVEVSDLSKGVYVISIEHEIVLGRGKLVKE